MTVADEVRGYHKPIMIAGGLGNIREEHVEQRQIAVGSALIVLGGPVMLIWILPPTVPLYFLKYVEIL